MIWGIPESRGHLHIVTVLIVDRWIIYGYVPLFYLSPLFHIHDIFFTTQIPWFLLLQSTWHSSISSSPGQALATLQTLVIERSADVISFNGAISAAGTWLEIRKTGGEVDDV